MCDKQKDTKTGDNVRNSLAPTCTFLSTFTLTVAPFLTISPVLCLSVCRTCINILVLFSLSIICPVLSRGEGHENVTEVWDFVFFELYSVVTTMQDGWNAESASKASSLLASVTNFPLIVVFVITYGGCWSIARGVFISLNYTHTHTHKQTNKDTNIHKHTHFNRCITTPLFRVRLHETN